MVLYEVRGLHEHTTGPTAGVVHAPLERLQDLNERPHHAGRRVELSGALAFLLGKPGKAVFVGATEDVLVCAVFNHLNVGE